MASVKLNCVVNSSIRLLCLSAPLQGRDFTSNRRGGPGGRLGLHTAAAAAVQVVPELRGRRAHFLYIKSFYNCTEKDKQLQRQRGEDLNSNFRAVKV